MNSLKPFLIAVFIITFGSLYAQTKDEHAVKYASTITKEELNEHLSVLASDEFAGRETADVGEHLAAYYLAGQFASLSLPPVVNGSYFQYFPLEKFTPEGTASADGKTFEFLDDFVYLTAAGKEFQVSEMVFCGFGIESDNYNDYENVDVSGKSIIVFSGEPTDKNGMSYVSGKENTSKTSQEVFSKYTLAQNKEAKHIFIVLDDFEEKTGPFKHFFGSEKMSLKNDTPNISDETMLFIISKKMAEAMFVKSKKSLDVLKNKINKKGKPNSFTLPTSLSMNTVSKVVETAGKNVLAFIEGTDLKDELVVITAHYDHMGVHDGEVFNGADDDGSGTVGLIEIAEAFVEAKKDGHGPRRSILVMPVSGEEKGLLGSQYYSENPVFPLENTITNLNIDMIGRIDEDHVDNPDYIYLIGSDMLSTDLHEIGEWANTTYVGLDLDYRFNSKDDPNNFYRRSDHYNFAKNNIPVIFYFNGTHEDYHKSTDTIEKIDFIRLESRTKLVFYTAWELANRDERPRLNTDVQ